MSLFDIENSVEIEIRENSIWIENNICFINSTQSFEFDFSDTIRETDCTMLIFYHGEGKFSEKPIEIETCLKSPCYIDTLFATDFFQNATILDGTSIICQQTVIVGIITKGWFKFTILKWGASSRWWSSLNCVIWNSDQMTIRKMHPTL